jgi:hypothetical protein
VTDDRLLLAAHVHPDLLSGYYLSLMQPSGLTNLVTNDKDFDRMRSIQVWKPRANYQD